VTLKHVKNTFFDLVICLRRIVARMFVRAIVVKGDDVIWDTIPLSSRLFVHLIIYTL
jgi:hypothetical protein